MRLGGMMGAGGKVVGWGMQNLGHEGQTMDKHRRSGAKIRPEKWDQKMNRKMRHLQNGGGGGRFCKKASFFASFTISFLQNGPKMLLKISRK
jgi:hypothetical protein